MQYSEASNGVINQLRIKTYCILLHIIFV